MRTLIFNLISAIGVHYSLAPRKIGVNIINGMIEGVKSMASLATAAMNRKERFQDIFYDRTLVQFFKI